MESLDPMFRCVECGRIVTMKRIKTYGKCKCGYRKVKEIHYLSIWEWIKIKLFGDQEDKTFLANFKKAKA
jgi:DNA-directed RNA polymerase subunit RPC12/RpoP